MQERRTRPPCLVRSRPSRSPRFLAPAAPINMRSDLEIARDVALKPIPRTSPPTTASRRAPSSPTASTWRRWTTASAGRTAAAPRARSTWSSPRSRRRPPARGRRSTPWAFSLALNKIGKKAACAIRQPSHGAGVRDQGRRGGRRPQPGRAHGGPPPDRRLPRGHSGQQPAERGDRRIDPPGQPVGHRPGHRHLATRPRRQRPGASPDHDRARRAEERRAPGDRLRHHVGVGGHGRARDELGPRRRVAPPTRAARSAPTARASP